jgi:hypothetical protein
MVRYKRKHSMRNCSLSVHSTSEQDKALERPKKKEENLLTVF